MKFSSSIDTFPFGLVLSKSLLPVNRYTPGEVLSSETRFSYYQVTSFLLWVLLINLSISLLKVNSIKLDILYIFYDSIAFLEKTVSFWQSKTLITRLNLKRTIFIVYETKMKLIISAKKVTVFTKPPTGVTQATKVPYEAKTYLTEQKKLIFPGNNTS